VAYVKAFVGLSDHRNVDTTLMQVKPCLSPLGGINKNNNMQIKYRNKTYSDFAIFYNEGEIIYAEIYKKGFNTLPKETISAGVGRFEIIN